MNKEDIEELMKSVEPIITMAAESDMQTKALIKHYIQTVSELTGKSEKDITAELEEIHSKVKEQELKKIEDKYGSKD